MESIWNLFVNYIWLLTKLVWSRWLDIGRDGMGKTRALFSRRTPRIIPSGQDRASCPLGSPQSKHRIQLILAFTKLATQ